jgi:hypothetical protein
MNLPLAAAKVNQYDARKGMKANEPTKRRRIIIRDHHLRVLLPHIRRLRALIVPIQHPLRRRPILTQIPLPHHPPKVEHAANRAPHHAAHIGLLARRARIVRAAHRLARLVEGGVRGEGGAVRGGRGGVDGEGVPVGGDAEGDLGGGEVGAGPGGDGGDGGALRVGGAGVVERGVGADAVGPGAPEVVLGEVR